MGTREIQNTDTLNTITLQFSNNFFFIHITRTDGRLGTKGCTYNMNRNVLLRASKTSFINHLTSYQTENKLCKMFELMNIILTPTSLKENMNIVSYI